MRLCTWLKLQFKSACGYDHILGGLCNDPVRRFTMNLITKVSNYPRHTLRGVQVAVSGRGPWLTTWGCLSVRCVTLARTILVSLTSRISAHLQSPLTEVGNCHRVPRVAACLAREGSAYSYVGFTQQLQLHCRLAVSPFIAKSNT